MKAQRLFQILGFVDEDLIDEAWTYAPAAKKLPLTRRMPWLRGAAAAACCVLVCTFGFWYLVTGGFRGMGSAAPETAAPETAGDSADAGSATTEESENGSSTSGDSAAGFLSYAGPVLPLTTPEPDTGLTAERALTLDFAPGAHADGTAGQWGAGVTDRYVLTNPTEADVTVTALYPVTGGLADLPVMAPELTVGGAAAEYKVYAGGYAGTFGDENDHDGSTHNLAGPYSWEDYAALVSDEDYLTGALGSGPDLDIPVTVYDFSDVTLTGEAERPELVVSCTFDPEETTILSYDFSSSNWDGSGTWRQYGERINPDHWGTPALIVLGADIDYALLADYGPDAPVLTAAECTVVRRETTLGEALADLCRTELADRDLTADVPLDQYEKAAAELLAAYGPLSDTPMDRYADGRLDDLLGEALTVDRVLYLAVSVTVPAGGSTEVTASFWKRPSYDFGGAGTGREDLQGFDVLTTAGSSLTFTGQTAALINGSGVEIVEDDFDFAPEGGTVSLDLQQPHYALTAQPVE